MMSTCEISSVASYTSPAEVHDYNNADGHGDTHNDSCHYMMRAKRKAADNDEEHDESRAMRSNMGRRE